MKTVFVASFSVAGGKLFTQVEFLPAEGSDRQVHEWDHLVAFEHASGR